MRRVALRGIGALECLLGAFALLWPGVWQEALHPTAIGTVFYPIQALAAGWLVRGLLTLRPAPAWARGAWLLELPMSGLFLLRAGLLGPWAAVAHGARLGLTLLALWLLTEPRRS